MFQCLRRVKTISLSQTRFWAPKLRPTLAPQNCGQLWSPNNNTALFAEDTAGSKFEAPILGPRKPLLHGANFYCLWLALAARRDSKSSSVPHFHSSFGSILPTLPHTQYIHMEASTSQRVIEGEMPRKTILHFVEPSFLYSRSTLPSKSASPLT